MPKSSQETEVLRKSVRGLLGKMVNSSSSELFDEAYSTFETIVGENYKPFLEYFDKNWLKKKEYWCKAWRPVSTTK